MSEEKGPKLFGNRAINALTNKWEQLYKVKVFKVRHFHDLTFDQRKEALYIVQSVKRKRMGTLRVEYVSIVVDNEATQTKRRQSPPVSTKGFFY